MNAAACLLVYSLAVLILAPPALRRLTHGGHAPRLGVTAWLTAVLSVLFPWAAAVALTIAETVRRCHRDAGVMTACVSRLHTIAAGDAGFAPQIVLIGTVAAITGAALVIAVRLTKSVHLLRNNAREHAAAVRIVGQRTDVDGVVVVTAENPAAYCVAGSPPAIVLTSATLVTLDDSELAAVLAHERAHLSGHHWIVVTMLRSLNAVLPAVGLISQAAQHVPRLLEMCADDTATRHHDPRALLSGLLALYGVVPSDAMAAADVAVLARIQRLSAPYGTLGRWPTLVGLSASVAVLFAGPWITAILATVGVLSCAM